MFRALGILVALMIGPSPAMAAKRALVIGNDSYAELPDLQMAVADAEAYSRVLGDLGYTVELQTDLPTQQIQQTIGAFIDTIAPGDDVVFAFSGHGWSDGSVNYIIGTDTPVKTSLASLRRGAVPLRNGTNGVIDDLQATGARVVLAVVDACRTNPFQSKTGRSGAVGLSRGMALVAPVTGTFTVFSAGAGEEALDRLGEGDTHPNSVFSRVFLKELAEGGSLQDIILDTAPQVTRLASQVGHAQRPAYYDGLGQRYCLSAECPQGQVVAAPAPPPSPAPAAPQSLAEATPPPAPAFGSLPTTLPSIQVVARADLGLASIAQLDDHYLCADEKGAGWPLAKSIIGAQIGSNRLRRYQSLEKIVSQLDRGKCDAIVVRLKNIPLVAEGLSDPSRFTLLPEVVGPDGRRTTPAATGAAARFAPPATEPPSFQVLIQSKFGLGSVTQLDKHYLCANQKDATWPLANRTIGKRLGSSRLRRYQSLDKLVALLQKGRCDGVIVPTRLVSDIARRLDDPSKYVLLPEVQR